MRKTMKIIQLQRAARKRIIKASSTHTFSPTEFYKYCLVYYVCFAFHLKTAESLTEHVSMRVVFFIIFFFCVFLYSHGPNRKPVVTTVSDVNEDVIIAKSMTLCTDSTNASKRKTCYFA